MDQPNILPYRYDKKNPLNILKFSSFSKKSWDKCIFY